MSRHIDADQPCLTVVQKQEEKQKQMEMLARKAAAERRRTMKRRVYCAVCGAFILETQRGDVGEDAPVETLGLCERCLP